MNEINGLGKSKGKREIREESIFKFVPKNKIESVV